MRGESEGHHGEGVSQGDVTAVRSFIGMTLYYRNYIHDYANKVAPLHALTRKGVNVPASWTGEHERAVDVLKEDLCSYPCLMNVDNSDHIRCGGTHAGGAMA